MPSPLVSIISINYNSLSDTLEFLESTKKISYPNIEIILIDNASKIDPGETILKSFPTVKYYRSKINLGFAGGNNLGIKLAVGDFLLFLNNDTIVPSDSITVLVEFMIANPKIGIASPKVLFEDGETIQYAGAKKINFLGRGNRIGLHEKDTGQYDLNYQTDLGHGAALIVPRKIINEVGLMPELYFLYYEEHDWCEQIKKRGYLMYYIGTSRIIHKESVSTGGDNSYTKVHYLNRNRILFMRRNFHGLNKLIGLIYYSIISLPLNLINHARKGKFNLSKAILDGVIWNLKHSPK